MTTLKIQGVSRRAHPSGRIAIPPSKSHTLRALLFGALASGKTYIHNYLKSTDTSAMIAAMRMMGATIEIHENTLVITGVSGSLKACDNIIHAGNSGIVLRFVTCLAALLPTYTVITGDHSIRHHRPMQPLLSALQQLGAFATSSRLDGFAPIIVRGPLTEGHAELIGHDSQPISGLLIAASLLPGSTELKVTNPGEKPWIDLTLWWLRRLGAKITVASYEHYLIHGSTRYEGFEITIPGDWSSAAFPLIAALITQSSITLENIDLNDIQGDKIIISLLSRMGARFEVDERKKTVQVLPSARLQGISIDANECIDALPILAVLGCFAEGTTEITNATIARSKESDRLHTITHELRKMGAKIEEKSDSLIITSSTLTGATLSSHADHRIAMALAVAALATDSSVSEIHDIDCINKSYPSFIDDVHRIWLT